ncbi:ssDNA-dependent ATPase MGS1 KNAG_0F00930 [Huiozyma naganishii CBS 8797]|uniref:UBZ4-type domain-containing protein n=1 Tax=Huiozyma naganishii (strain ATCC MYA-139 / BCRC 22969 / CBS 8797 / KCTC 17520 / NBRC 10181 / NCYC 3082 / Yp74L-3) TaxID=1071383 RepID=J7RZT8_HUIN7|nr:hypothetical protein KNAG_0F00930 [Kazachstania naganishii CBS 8797]CCK70762.1 hypothetical protein KNAG_0F00930 [Kazachstania naganishii CBS 8797]
MQKGKQNAKITKIEQQVSCPVCKKQVPYSRINAHVDIHMHRSSLKSGLADSAGSRNDKTSITDILSGSQPPMKRRKPDSSQSVIKLDDDGEEEQDEGQSLATTGAISLVKIEDSDVQKPKDKVRVDNNDTNSLRYLQRISSLPLSEKLRPKTLQDYVGQQHILSSTTGTLYKYIQLDQIPSMILWGPPGVGKTSLARLLTKSVDGKYLMIETSATKSNTQELKAVFEKAKAEYRLTKRRVILFIDEIHRFNKPQQDLLLPHVENGDIVLIGATTENPSFQLNNALISRCHVFVLEKLSSSELGLVLNRAIALLNKLRTFIWHCSRPLKLAKDAIEYIEDVCIGDTRRALNLLEMVEISSRRSKKGDDEDFTLSTEEVRNIIKNNSSNGLNSYYDPKGDNHYDTISAFHKSVRGSDENAALYYLGRMLKGGEDPLYIARRMIRIASEDIGIRDNTMLPLAIAAHDAVMKVGLPEADMALVQCCVSLARAPKSVEIYRAWNKLKSMLDENKYSMCSSEIPMHIRNAPTKLMEDIGYSKGYKYNPDYKDGKVAQMYFPQEILDQCEDKTTLKFLTGKHLGSKMDPDLELQDK